jgi:hypothetical protein
MSAELRNHFEVPSGSEKNFGIIFGVVFLLIGIYPLLRGDTILLWAVGVAFVFLVLAYLQPQVLSVPNKLWFKLGIILGAIVAPIIMLLVYFTIVVPIGLLMKLIGKDLLQQKLDGEMKSYWIKLTQPVGSMKDQF